MSGVPIFGVFYDLASMIVTKTIYIDISPTDSDANVQLGLIAYQQPNEGIIFVGQDQAGELGDILGGLGIALTA